MDGLSAYILDTNVISDYIRAYEPTTSQVVKAIQNQHLIYLCDPVRYEVLRGLIKVGAKRKRKIFEEMFAPLLSPLRVIDDDWLQGAKFWADARSAGKQLSDMDLLIAALAYRLNAIIVSSDTDFDVLPVKREDWRKRQ